MGIFGPKPEEVKAEKDLEGRMSKIELFLGSLDEFEKLKGCHYEIIDLPGNYKFLRGELNQFKHLRGSTGEKVQYKEIVRKAVELNADAIIRYTIIDNSMIRYDEMGIPVKKSVH